MRRAYAFLRGRDLVVVLDTNLRDDVHGVGRYHADELTNQLIRECHVVNVVQLGDVIELPASAAETLQRLERTARELEVTVILVTERDQWRCSTVGQHEQPLVVVYVLPPTLFNDPARYDQCLTLAIIYAELTSLSRYRGTTFAELYVPDHAASTA